MSKRRTRVEKENVHYPFLISWQGSTKNKAPEARVKRESENRTSPEIHEARHPKSAEILAKDEENTIIKKDIIKSLLTTSLILILELVVYLAWKRI